MKKSIYSVCLLIAVVFVLLSACSKTSNTRQTAGVARDVYVGYEDNLSFASNSAAGSAVSIPKSVSYANAMSESYAYDAVEESTVPAPQKRMVKKSASINIQVADPIGAAAEISSWTENMGGFVVSSSNTQEYYNADTYLPKATLSIRVPAKSLNETLDFIENLTGDASKYVSNKRVFGADITSDYVDSRSRLTSLEKTRDKLYEIMDTAENAEEALEIYNRISDVETEIEVYKGQIKYMEDSVSLSSVEIQISSIRPAPIHTVQSWSISEVFSDAFESLLDVGKSAIECLIKFVIVIVPAAIMIAVPIVLIVFLVRKIVLKAKSKKSKE